MRILSLLTLLLAGCAGSHPGHEVSAAVEDRPARQAEAATTPSDEGREAALEAGAEAAPAAATGKTEPPNP